MHEMLQWTREPLEEEEAFTDIWKRTKTISYTANYGVLQFNDLHALIWRHLHSCYGHKYLNMCEEIDS